MQSNYFRYNAGWRLAVVVCIVFAFLQLPAHARAQQVGPDFYDGVYGACVWENVGDEVPVPQSIVDLCIARVEIYKQGWQYYDNRPTLTPTVQPTPTRIAPVPVATGLPETVEVLRSTNIRTIASTTTGKPVCQAPAGAVLPVLERVGEWVKVALWVWGQNVR